MSVTAADVSLIRSVSVSAPAHSYSCSTELDAFGSNIHVTQAKLWCGVAVTRCVKSTKLLYGGPG